MGLLKQSIRTNAIEIYSLYNSIAEYLYRPVVPGQKISISEILAYEPLRKVCKRLQTKFEKEYQVSRYREFEFTFSAEELLAIRVCIRSSGSNPVLDVILGKAWQKTLNYDYKIELTPKSLKQ